jgi:hypothetical protein
MTAQAFEFDGPRGYRLAGRLALSDDQRAAVHVGSRNWRCKMGHHQRTQIALRRRFPSAGAAHRCAPGHYHDLVMEACNA